MPHVWQGLAQRVQKPEATTTLSFCRCCRPGELSALALVPAQHVRSAQGALAAAHAAVQAPLRAAFRLLGPAPLAALDAVIYQLMSSEAARPALAMALAAVLAVAVARAGSSKGSGTSRTLLVVLPLLALLVAPRPADAVGCSTFHAQRARSCPAQPSSPFAQRFLHMIMLTLLFVAMRSNTCCHGRCTKPATGCNPSS